MSDGGSGYSYDEVPYPSYSYPQTHPDHLATLAALSGIDPPPIESARILELGCGGGGNLLPIAYGLPDSECTGIDLSTHAIEEGRRLLAELDLRNVTLRQQDFLEVDPDELGRFDYVIVYGIYSWVPRAVQDRLLGLCNELLTPNGLAYISYNARPGWGMNSVVRDAMIYHTRNASDPQDRIRRARSFVEFMATMTPEDEPYGQSIRRLNEFLQSMEDGYVFHDFMEEVNEPLYFHEFIDRVHDHDLQYLANAELVRPGGAPAAVIEAVTKLTDDPIEAEQYLDFLTNRAFRETVLCRAGLDVARSLRPATLRRLRVASRARPEDGEIDLRSSGEVTFIDADGTELAASHPLTKAALVHLEQAWPRSVPFEELVAGAAARLGPELAAPDAREVDLLATNLMLAYEHSMNLVELHAGATGFGSFSGAVTARPLASHPARLEARRELSRVTNMAHQRVTVGDIPRRLLPLLDGTRDHEALLGALSELADEGVIELDEQQRADPASRDAALRALLESVLADLAAARLLVG